jgi:hypothetical protein
MLKVLLVTWEELILFEYPIRYALLLAMIVCQTYIWELVSFDQSLI